MATHPSPELKRLLAAWRRRAARGGLTDARALDELESHLLDEVDAQLDAGRSEREAFLEAAARLGHEDVLSAEYEKVAAWKAARRRGTAYELTWRGSMLKNYLRTACRTLLRQKGYAFINVFGLSLGIACCVLLFLYVRDELTFDRFHEQQDRIYRVHKIGYTPQGAVEWRDVHLPMPLGPAMQAELPEVERYVRFQHLTHLARRGNGEAVEQEVLYADPSVFDVFTFPLRAGDPATALADPASIVLTRTAARRYFGDENPIGQRLTLRLDQAFVDFTVTAVAEDVPSNSGIRFEALVPFANYAKTASWVAENLENWDWSSFVTYVLLREGASAADLAAKLPAFWRAHYPDRARELRATGRWTGDGQPSSYGLQPLVETHLDLSVPSGLIPTSNPLHSYVLSGIALAVLLIACINFMLLAIGRSARRAREVGIRKVVGAHRSQLMLQFWSEAVLLGAVALAIGLLLAWAFLPAFNSLAGKSLRFDLGDGATPPLVLAGMVLFVGLVAGGYPALLLSGFHPVDTLKSRHRLGGTNVFTRALVVVQFALSVFLVSSTFVMLDQLAFVRAKNLGFDREQVVVIQTSGLDGRRLLPVYQQALGGRPDVLGVAAVSHAFTQGLNHIGFDYRKEDRIEQKGAVVYSVTPGFVGLMGMEVVAGRDFDPALGSDTTQAVIVNEALVRDFGWTNPVGEVLTGFLDQAPVVIGVVRDFHFGSLHEEVQPMLLMMNGRRGMNALLVRLAPGDVDQVAGALGALRSTWAKVAPDLPFRYSFLDDDLDEQYQGDERWSRIVAYAAFFAILVACLGLLGLAALSVAGRTKEIGIRKVLGASVPRLVRLLAREFAVLVVVSIALAVPVAYVVMSRWLEGFAYRVELGWGLFALAGAGALLVALLPVGYQAGRAALADPVKSLRFE